MSYPSHRPTSRSFEAGDYPVKTYKSQSGVELRILYGDKRTGVRLQLSYDNIPDTAADDFLNHYNDTKGTFLSFTLPSQFRTGWSGTASAIDVPSDNQWRYESPPSVQQVRPGISSVKVNLIGVL